MLRKLRTAAFMKPLLVGEDDVMIQFVCQACTESTVLLPSQNSDFETPRVTTYGQKRIGARGRRPVPRRTTSSFGCIELLNLSH